MRGGALGRGIVSDGVHGGGVMGALLEDTPLAAKDMLCNHTQPLLHHNGCLHCWCPSQCYYDVRYQFNAVIGIGLGSWPGLSMNCCHSPQQVTTN